ncbi:MAG: D-alanyl-D-alanine carboxypeptidase [Clostridia bacterium]|nr:D-alanyl-D-alanine carboxypeptidase [Clostridia bacterium]
MKRLLTAFLSLIFCIPFAIPADAAEVSAEAAILIEASTGTPLYEKDADRRLPMASTTKIMTALVVFEHTSPDAVIEVPADACGIEGSSVYLRPGERIRCEDLLWSVLLESANDAAAALAISVGGSVEGFAAMMNEKAASLGLSDTHFTNPHGLDDEEHYTTARDLAKLTVAAMAHPAFRTMVSTRRHTIEREGGARVLINHNRLLRMSDDVVGVKTGFTRRSGRCLVSAAQKDGAALVCVTLNAPDDWNDHLKLYEEGFAKTHAVSLAEPGQFSCAIPCPHADDGEVTVSNRSGITRVFFGDVPQIDTTVEAKRLLLENTEIGDVLGRVVFRADRREIASLPLTAEERAAAPEKPSFFSHFIRNGSQTEWNPSESRNT